MNEICWYGGLFSVSGAVGRGAKMGEQSCSTGEEGGDFFAATLYPKSCVHPCFKLKHLPSFAHPQVFPVQQEALLPPPLLADSETKEIAKRNM